MQYSKSGLTLTESFEGCRLQSYQDSVGIWTIGYGHTRGVTKGMTCTQAQAEAWLLEDIQEAINAVSLLVHVPLKQNQFDALVDFVFNVGSGNFANSTLRKLINAGQFTEAAGEFLKWDMAGGKHIPGLTRRRAAEQKEFIGDNNGA